jgi:hypothetical protein
MWCEAESIFGAAMKCVFLVIIGLASSGCGTVCNLSGGLVHPEEEPRIYGGLIRDIEIIDKMSSGVASKPGGSGAAVIAVAVLAIVTVDPIMSLVADTLTLPITIPLQEARTAQNNKEYYSSPSANPPTTSQEKPKD